MPHWFFGNLYDYEEIVRMPDRLADDRSAGRREGMLASGSPARYYVPAVPVMVGATIATVVGGWPRSDERGALAVGGVCSATGVALTGYLVRTVVHRLLVGPELTDEERTRLVRRWHRVNRVRLVLAAASSLALRRAARAGAAAQ